MYSIMQEALTPSYIYIHSYTQKLVFIFTGPLPETPRGNKYIITTTDYFSKWPEAAALQDKTALGVANFLFSLFCCHGWPEIIISDQGREFVNAVTRLLSPVPQLFYYYIAILASVQCIFGIIIYIGACMIVLVWNTV